MSTLTTTVNTSEIASLATGFLAKSAEVRRVVKQAIQGAPEIASAVIMAGQFAIEDAMTDTDKAFILKGITRGRILVEGGKQPVAERCYAVIAEAESKHFDIGTKQYSIWSNGTLYVKEDGFRRLFELRDDCSELDTDIKPPVWMKLQDRSCWHVPVKAWVTVKGRGKVSVDCTVGVNGNLTDGIAKIESHAERSVLKKLWKKVTSIVIEEEGENDVVNGSVIIVEEPVAAITEKQQDESIAAAKQFSGDYDRCVKMLSSDPSAASVFQDIWKTIADCKTLEELDCIAKDSAALFHTFSKDVQLKIKAFSGERRKELAKG
jgi:hypothetical protein